MAAIPETTLRLWAFNSPDAAIRDVLAVVEYTAGYDKFFKAVRGKWVLQLVQGSAFVPVTAPVTVTNPKKTPFRLGSPSARLKFGEPVYLQITYSARDGAEALFWESATNVNCTINLN